MSVNVLNSSEIMSVRGGSCIGRRGKIAIAATIGVAGGGIVGVFLAIPVSLMMFTGGVVRDLLPTGYVIQEDGISMDWRSSGGNAERQSKLGGYLVDAAMVTGAVIGGVTLGFIAGRFAK